MPVERKLPLILSFVFLMLAAVGFLVYRGSVSFQAASEAALRSQAVVADLDEIVTSVADIESSTTGFITTGVDNYLEPANEAKSTLKKSIADLRTAFDGDETRLAQVTELDSLIAQKIEIENNRVDQRKQKGYDQSIYTLGQNAGSQLTRQIRSSVDKLKNDELAKRANRQQGNDANLNLTVLILILSSLAGLAALIAGYVLVRNEMGRRRSAEASLVDANRGLETRIEERTAELKDANDNLIENARERERLLVNEQTARKEAEIANRLRDEFMATISHELRTPLNSILGWARLLKDGDLDEEKQVKAISTIVKNSETQNRLIEDLLDAARIISGKLQIEREPVNFEEIVVHSIETVRPAADLKNIEIDLDVESDGDAHMDGDKDRLQQVVCNLLTNAVKFTPNGGRINVDLGGANGSVVLNIRDNGAGITPDFLPNVFERFRQDSATIKQSGGLGLGLAVVRNLVEMHGGTVEAASEGEGRGSTFTVKLPRRDKGSAAVY